MNTVKVMALVATVVILCSCSTAPRRSSRRNVPNGPQTSGIALQKLHAQSDHEQQILMTGYMDMSEDIREELLQRNYPVTMLPQYNASNITVYHNPAFQSQAYQVNPSTSEVISSDGEQISISLQRSSER